VALFGRPGLGAATFAANQVVPTRLVPDIVPTTLTEREAVMARAFAIPKEPPPPPPGNGIRCIALHGDRDWLLPVDVLPRLVRSLPPGTASHVIAGAGHVPYFTHAAVCARIILPWLDALCAEGRRSAA
jgi:pimeloyl-ACP methyl ester carboxylesterase